MPDVYSFKNEILEKSLALRTDELLWGIKQVDFMKMPIADNTYDVVYSIEASCYAFLHSCHLDIRFAFAEEYCDLI